MGKHRVFVSSVQKEMESERLAIASLITTDPFLMEHCEPVLFDREPITGRKASKPYLACLDGCAVYLLLINREYGRPHGELSATHQEYRHAQKRKLPSLVFVKGGTDADREPMTQAFFDEIKANGYTYKRFVDRLDLRTEVRAALINLLKDEYGLAPQAGEDESGEQNIEAASPFESRQTDLTWDDLDHKLAREWLEKAGDIPGSKAAESTIIGCLRTRGLLWRDRKTGQHHALAAGILFLGRNPSAPFPQSRIMADAYRGIEPDPTPSDQMTVSVPAPKAIDAVVAFVGKNTRHPPRIVGMNRVMLDEYPEKAIREALVNAIAHRDYEDSSRQIIVEVFADRVVISSPGLPPPPLSLAKLRKGKYRPCSRNAVLAQSLAVLNLMEQRGSGLARMKAAMLDHGLDAPRLDVQDGYFQVILAGPADNLDRLRTPAKIEGAFVPPSVEQQMNERQKAIVTIALENGVVTSGWCRKRLPVAYDTIRRDLLELVKLGVLEQKGKGRSTRYIVRIEHS
jgi:ATP-dependent DNA helicase RecG